MNWSLKAIAFAGCIAVAGCSGGDSIKKSDASVDKTGLDGSVKGPEDTISVGDMVDTDGDGVADGVAVDTDGDGIADGIDTNEDGVADEPVPTTDGGVASGDAAGDGSSPFPASDAGAVLCGSAPCLCSDGIDNDMDGLSDLLDPECISTWDNDESSLATGIPGDNRDDACQDCFFDGNSGAGDDGCKLPSSCITEGNASSGHGSCNTCQQTAECKSFCQAYTPNGCDCFGCCDVKVGSTIKHLLLSSACSIDGETLTGCTECIPSTSCVNTCGKCELCAGKTINDLPADCTPPPATTDAGTPVGDSGTPFGDSGTVTAPPPAYTCDNGEQICGDGQLLCPFGSLCQFGCCILSPLLF